MGQVHSLHSPHEHTETRTGTAHDWRSGRPAEDPEKTKRWGRITAKPSEYLVVMRRGRVRERYSGQGASYFKWPADAVAVIPTSLQKLAFTADQVTREKTGVAVTGLAVYRIADPLLAFRVLNFAYPERAQQKLEETLTSMFIGATRRLVANLSLEECLQKRKSALAEELIREVAPVVGGEGKPSDSTTKGWGVVIDTIEIQEVRVSSERVFSAMQAPYRQALEQRAHEARAESEREMALKSTRYSLDIEAAKIDAELETQRRQSELEEARAAAAKDAELRALADRSEIEQQRAAQQKASSLRELQDYDEVERSRAATERDATLRSLRVREEVAAAERDADVRAARADLEAGTVLEQALTQRLEQERAEQAAAVERREREAAIARLEAQVRAEAALADAKAMAERARAKAEVLRAKRLPELAAAVGQRFGEVKITQLGHSGESPFAGVAQAVAAVVELAKNG